MRSAAVLGCGKYQEGKVGWAIGHYHAEGYLEADPAMELYGVDPNPENLAAFGKRFKVPPNRLFPSAEALYAQLIPDYVSVCTWPALHAPMVLEAARLGVKGVVCEKPVALNGLEIQKMIQACRESGTQLAVAHQRRHEARFQALRKVIQTGELGTQLVLEARVADNWDILSWTVHWFDMANYLLNALPEWIMAGIHHEGQRRYQQAVETSSIIMAQYPENRQAIFITGPEVPDATEWCVRGTKGTAILRAGVAELILMVDGKPREDRAMVESANAFASVISELFSAVENGTEMRCSATHCAAATEMAYAAHESARTLRRVPFPTPIAYAPLEVVQSTPRPWLPEGRIVLFADEHFGSGGREGIADAIERETNAGRPHIIPAGEGLRESDLEGVGTLLIYHTQPTADATTRTTLRRWVESGKPLVILHAGLGAYPDWPEYLQWCGRHWVWDHSTHPHEASEIEIMPGIRLPLLWQTAHLPEDEVFIQLGDAAPVRDLMQVRISNGQHPAAWINTQHPNVGVLVPGHRRDMWNLPPLQQSLFAVIQEVSHK